MAKGYLTDTCAAIKYLNETFPKAGISFMDKALKNKTSISFVSEIELQVYVPSSNKDIDAYINFISNSIIIGIDDDIIKHTIKIRKKYNLKIPDAIIAATAIVNDLILISDNDKDFVKIHGLQYINPAKIK